MNESNWTLLHDVLHLYYLVGLTWYGQKLYGKCDTGASETERKAKKRIEEEQKHLPFWVEKLNKQKNFIHNKIAEWPIEKENLESLYDSVFKRFASDELLSHRDLPSEIPDLILGKTPIIIERINRYLPADNKKFIIEDLITIALQGTNQSGDYNAIRKIAHALQVDYEKVVDDLGLNTADDKELLQDIAVLFFILAHGIDHELNDKEAEIITDKVQEWWDFLSISDEDENGDKTENELKELMKSAMSKYKTQFLAQPDLNLTPLVLKLKYSLDDDFKRQVLINDLVEISLSDDSMSNEEKAFILHVADLIIDMKPGDTIPFRFDTAETDEDEDKAAAIAEESEAEPEGNSHPVRSEVKYLGDDTTPAYPGDFYFVTEKYSQRLIRFKNMRNRPEMITLLRKFTSEEVSRVIDKIKKTKTIPLLTFVNGSLYSAYENLRDEVNLKPAFWFVPFVIMGEKVGCMLYFEENGFYGNYNDANSFEMAMHCDPITGLSYEKGFIDPDDVLFEDHENSEVLSSILLETDDGHLSVEEFHGKNYGSHLSIIEAIWDLWEPVVEYNRNSPLLQKNIPGGPSYKEFSSWDAIIEWSNKIEKEGTVNKETFPPKGIESSGENLSSETLYREQVKKALSDGNLSDLDKVGLEFMQNKLGLSDEASIRIMGEVIAELQDVNASTESPAAQFGEHRDRPNENGFPDHKLSPGKIEKDEIIVDEETGKRVTYANWSEFEKEQGRKDELKKANLPIAKKIHDFILDFLKGKNVGFEIRYGDGTLSFSIPKGESKSAKRTFARVGLLSIADKSVYLDTLYKGPNDPLPPGGIPRKKNDPTQFLFRMKTVGDFEKVQESIKVGLIKSYNVLAAGELNS